MEYNIEFIINEITNIIKDNLLLLLNREDSLINLKKYCQNDLKLQYTPYNDLIYFIEEALTELINTDYLYDFRDIE